ncbi:MAG: hypothetical protein M1818_001921 [Claussenomyces sp. TS43310]|nr:MAG: hypothetical protein M1818_001921 [Claussenomyces sp. TS43310]
MASQTSLEFASLDATDWTRQQQQDDAALQSLLHASAEGGESGVLDLNRDLDVGEKADDAEDFEDISDDDLPEEEETSGGIGLEGPGLTDDGGTSHEADDLFGDADGDDLFGRDSSPLEQEAHDGVHIKSGSSSQVIGGHLTLPSLDSTTDFREINFDAEPKPFGAANQDLSIPAPAETQDELLKQIWPKFRKGSVINWTELLPPKIAHHIPKKPAKTPKPVNLTKVSLDLAPDQERVFRVSAASSKNKWQRETDAKAKGCVAILEESSDEQSSPEEFDWEDANANERIGNVTWTDLELMCDDWEARLDPVVPDLENFEEPDEMAMDDEDAAWLAEFGVPAAKRRKTSHSGSDVLTLPSFPVPSFDDFERVTSHVAKRPILDLNDPQLLVDYQDAHPSKRLRLGAIYTRGANEDFSKAIRNRFNLSNDEAYDALKENHQNKVRATLATINIEHSMPALKLQWPYYRVKLYTREARSYHRPALKFNKFMNQNITFSKSGLRKRKHMKNLTTQQIFEKSTDLSLADNSSAMLLEYSEEHPTVLSNFGMGSKIINYYRRKDAEDTTRPKLDVGETNTLQPEDRSPFAQFGRVAPGETVPTLHNAMYRAPVFKQDNKDTDFLMMRSTTGVNGSSWHIRNIDHLFVVGQQLPSMEIPGPQSRKFTNAAKNRMRMLAFRKIRHSPNNTVRIDEITSHIADSSDMQNRQKLKEFIKYHKDEKVWRVKSGDVIPDEATVRSWVKPEDICTIDAMQVGLRHLEDAGYGRTDEAEEESEEEKEGDSLEQRLAPWKTTKSFLDASAGKAMLQLHGEGDPSGCGLAFSFIKTSMKGGFLDSVQRSGPQSTSADHIAQERKANGGHRYNVDKQNIAYAEAINDIWQKQRESLSNTKEPTEDVDMEHPLEIEDSYGVAATPYSAATPANFDDSASALSRFSSSSRKGRTMRIVRRVRNKNGQYEEVAEIVRDQRVWREYLKRRHAIDAELKDVYEARPTGDAEFDRKEQIRIKKELMRLERNKERRHAREKQKGIFRPSAEPEAPAGSPSATPAISEKPTGTTRKCANCGQAGHIKTNKKLCPLLNGTMKPEDSGLDHGFGAIATPFAT